MRAQRPRDVAGAYPSLSNINEIQQGNRQVIVYGSNSRLREIAPL